MREAFFRRGEGQVNDKNIKILIVEDEIISAQSYALGLKGLGYEICPLATTGEKGIEIAENERPDIVIMDLGLHGGMDGIEAATKIKDCLRIPIIFVTGYLDEDLKERAGVTESYEYLFKPVNRTDLKNSIEMALRK